VSPDSKDLTLETSPEEPPQSAPIHARIDRASLAHNFLSFAHTEAQTHISNLHLSTDSDDSLAGYLDGALKLLDLCNSISSLIERLRLCRLSLNFVLHLLAPFYFGFPAPEKVRRARDLLSDWGKPSFDLSKWGFRSNPEDLIRDLALGLSNAPHGKISSANKLLRRTIWLWASSGLSSVGGTRCESCGLETTEDGVVKGTGNDVVSDGGRRVFFFACGFCFCFCFFLLSSHMAYLWP